MQGNAATTILLPNGVSLAAAPHGLVHLLQQAATGVERGVESSRGDRFLPGPEGLRIHVPRAANARATLRGRMGAWEGYRCQEKLDGVYVLWTGARLFTKTGLEVPAPSFTDWLPPFPVVGELYCGCNRLDRARNLVTRPHNNPDWACARLVAFDVPGCEPREQWPYVARYALLRHVVGAWNARHRSRLQRTDANNAAALCPLQLIRQYPMARLPELFRHVVHGTPWTGRTGMPPFGVPTTARTADGSCLVAIAVADDDHADRAWWPCPGGPYADATLAASGEGCMLWQQDGLWEARSRSGRGTMAILKYKPTMLLVGRVLTTPYPSHRTPWRRREADDTAGVQDGGGADDADRLPGFHCRVAWYDPFAEAQVTITTYIPPSADMEGLLQRFRQGTRTFVSFVAYGQRPEYTVALGPRLTSSQAEAVQAHLVACLWDTSGSGTTPRLRDVPNKTELAEAVTWNSRDVRALFPSDFAWYPEMVCEHAVRPRWLVSHPLLAASSSARLPPPPAAARNKRARQDPEAVRAAWMGLDEKADGGFARRLLGMLFVTAAWNARRGTGEAAAHPDVVRGSGGWMRSWGPFRIAPSDLAAQAGGVGPPTAVERDWMERLLEALLTLAAGLWIHLGGAVFTHRDLWMELQRSPGDTLNQLQARVRRYVQQIAAPRWNVEAVQAMVVPPGDERVAVFPPTRSANVRIHLGIVARYVERELGGVDAWLAYLQQPTLAGRRPRSAALTTDVPLTASQLRLFLYDGALRAADVYRSLPQLLLLWGT